MLMTLLNARSLTDFIAGRIARLYPTYLVSVILAGAYGIWADTLSYATFFINVTMLQRFLAVRDIVTAYWTLSFEIWFYMVLAMLYRWKRIPNLDVLALVWLAAMVTTRLVEAWILGAPIGKLEVSRLYLFLMPQFGHFFIIGLMLYKLVRGRATRLTAIVLTLAVCYSIFGRGGWGAVSPIAYLLATILFAVAVWGAAISGIRILAAKPLVFLGSCSYPLYLLHQTVGSFICDLTERINRPRWLGLLIAIPASIALAMAVHMTIEEPVHRWVKQKLTGEGILDDLRVGQRGSMPPLTIDATRMGILLESSHLFDP